MNLELGLGLTSSFQFLLYLGGIVALLLTLFWRVEIGLVYITILLPQQNLIDRLEEYPLGQQVIHLFVLVIALKWLLARRKSGEPILCRTMINWPLLAFIAFTLFGLYWGTLHSGVPLPTSYEDPRFVNWKNLLIPFVLYFSVVNVVKTRQQILLMVLAMTVSMLIMDRTFYANFFRPDHYTNSLKAGGAGAFTYLGANELSAFYAMYSPILLSLFIQDQSKWRRILYGIAVLGNYYSLLFLFSRGGYFAMLVGLIVLGVLRHRVVLAGILLILTMWRLVTPTAVIERIDMSLGGSSNGLDRTTEERYSMWRTGVRLVSSSPVLGVGYSVIPSLGIQDEISGKTRRSLHNGYITLLAELGAVGMGLWLAILFCAARMGFRLLRLADDGFTKALGVGSIACILASAAYNVTGDAWPYFSVMGFFWITFALVGRSIIILEQERSLSPAIEPSRTNETGLISLSPVHTH